MAGESGAIEFRVTSDSSQVRSDMENLAQSVNKGTARMVRDIDGVTSTHNNLLRSDHRVAASLRGLTSEALTTGDAFSTVGRGLESLAMATNVSLPALIGLEVVGKLIQDIAKAHAEAVKLNKELDEAGKPRDPKSTIPIEEDIKSRLAVIEKAKKDIAAQNENPWPTGTNWIRNFGLALMTPNKEGPGSELYSGVDRAALQRGEGSAAITPRNPAARDLKNLEIEEQKLKAAEATTAALKEQEKTEKALANLAGVVAKEKLGKLSFSLEELAKKGREWAPGDDSRPGAGRLAKRALKEEELARKEMLAEHYTEAFQHQANADRIKNDIIPLKDTEKDHLNAIQRAQVFKDMINELRDLRRELYVGAL